MKNMIVTIFIFGLLVISFDAFSEVARRDAGGAAAAKAQLLLRQISADRDAVKAENADLQKKLDKLQAKFDKLKSDKKRLSSKINRADQAITKYNDANQKLRERINKDRDRTKELIAKFRETVITLKRVETQRSKLDVNLKSAKEEISSCAKNNVELYDTNLELVELYKEKSVWDSMLQNEPVTQLGRVAIENVGQKYVTKMQEFRFVSNDLDE